MPILIRLRILRLEFLTTNLGFVLHFIFRVALILAPISNALYTSHPPMLHVSLISSFISNSHDFGKWLEILFFGYNGLSNFYARLSLRLAVTSCCVFGIISRLSWHSRGAQYRTLDSHYPYQVSMLRKELFSSIFYKWAIGALGPLASKPFPTRCFYTERFKLSAYSLLNL